MSSTDNDLLTFREPCQEPVLRYHQTCRVCKKVFECSEAEFEKYRRELHGKIGNISVCFQCDMEKL